MAMKTGEDEVPRSVRKRDSDIARKLTRLMNRWLPLPQALPLLCRITDDLPRYSILSRWTDSTLVTIDRTTHDLTCTRPISAREHRPRDFTTWVQPSVSSSTTSLRAIRRMHLRRLVHSQCIRTGELVYIRLGAERLVVNMKLWLDVLFG